MGMVFGQNRICGKCGGKQRIATAEDRAHRASELARIRRLEVRTGEPQVRPPYVKSDCPACGGKGYV